MSDEQPKEKIPQYPDIASELQEMWEIDQSMRKGRDDDSAPWDEMVDQRNTARMKEIIAQIGFPTISMVGEKGASQTWLLIQHADHDVEFQKHCLELMKNAPEGEIRKEYIAYLEDRTRVNSKQGQLYGTQFDQRDGKHVPRLIEDEEHVDERRAEMGMDTLDDQIQGMYKKYGAPKEKENVETGEIDFDDVTVDNLDKLISLRKVIDEPVDVNKLNREVGEYVNDKYRKAFLVSYKGIALGYVEVNLSEDLPEGAPTLDNHSNLAHLSRVGVLPFYEGRSLGTRLLKRAEQWVKEQDKEGIWLDYLADDKKLVWFYEDKNGYKKQSDFPDKNKKGKTRRIVSKTF